MSLALQIDYERFLQRPTRESYLLVRLGLVESSDWPPCYLDVVSLAESLWRRDLEGACERLDGMMPLWALSPRAHQLAGVLAELQGDAESAELSRFEAESCLSGLLATGRGTSRRPYQVTYPSDVHDLLHAVGRVGLRQEVIERDGRFFDAVTCPDGTQVWAEFAHDDASEHDRQQLAASNWHFERLSPRYPR